MTLPTQVHIVKAMVFPVVMYGCESWTIKKTGHQGIAFELWCWKRLLRVLDCSLRMQEGQTSQSWRKSTLKIQWNDWCRSWSSNTLTTWCKEPIHWKRPWFWERLKAGWEGDDRGWLVGWHHWLSRHEFEQTLGDGEGQGSLTCHSPWGCKESDTTKRLNNNSNGC